MSLFRFQQRSIARTDIAAMRRKKKKIKKKKFDNFSLVDSDHFVTAVTSKVVGDSKCCWLRERRQHNHELEAACMRWLPGKEKRTRTNQWKEIGEHTRASKRR